MERKECCRGKVLIEKLLNFDKVDFANIGFAFSAVILFILVRKYGLLDAVQLAKDTIVDHTKEGLVVVDTNYNLLYANPIMLDKFPDACKRLRKEDKRAFQELFMQEKSVCDADGIYCEICISKLYEGTENKYDFMFMDDKKTDESLSFLLCIKI